MTTFESSDNKHKICTQLKLIDPTPQERKKERKRERIHLKWD